MSKRKSSSSNNKKNESLAQRQYLADCAALERLSGVYENKGDAYLQSKVAYDFAIEQDKGYEDFADASEHSHADSEELKTNYLTARAEALSAIVKMRISDETNPQDTQSVAFNYNRIDLLQTAFKLQAMYECDSSNQNSVNVARSKLTHILNDLNRDNTDPGMKAVLAEDMRYLRHVSNDPLLPNAKQALRSHLNTLKAISKDSWGSELEVNGNALFDDRANAIVEARPKAMLLSHGAESGDSTSGLESDASRQLYEKRYKSSSDGPKKDATDANKTKRRAKKKADESVEKESASRSAKSSASGDDSRKKRKRRIKK